jgi:hypothetical protein
MSKTITALVALIAITALQSMLMLQAVAGNFEPQASSSKDHASSFAPCNRTTEVSHPRSRLTGPPQPDLKALAFVFDQMLLATGTAYGDDLESAGVDRAFASQPIWLVNRALLI